MTTAIGTHFPYKKVAEGAGLIVSLVGAAHLLAPYLHAIAPHTFNRDGSPPSDCQLEAVTIVLMVEMAMLGVLSSCNIGKAETQGGMCAAAIVIAGVGARLLFFKGACQ